MFQTFGILFFWVTAIFPAGESRTSPRSFPESNLWRYAAGNKIRAHLERIPGRIDCFCVKSRSCRKRESFDPLRISRAPGNIPKG